MNSLPIGHVRRWRRFAGLFALLLVFASSVPTHAIYVLDYTAGIGNSGFGATPNCSLTSWTGTGSFSAVDTTIGERRTCAGQIHVWTGMPGASTAHTSTLEQRFLVTAATFGFYLIPETDRPNTGYSAQTVALYDNSGQLIHEKSRNSTLDSDGERFSVYLYTYDLSRYVNQYITLRVQVSIDSAVVSSPTMSRLTIDFDCPFIKVCGGTPGGVGAGGW